MQGKGPNSEFTVLLANKVGIIKLGKRKLPGGELFVKTY